MNDRFDKIDEPPMTRASSTIMFTNSTTKSPIDTPDKNKYFFFKVGGDKKIKNKLTPIEYHSAHLGEEHHANEVRSQLFQLYSEHVSHQETTE